jgi:hypothetical protein
MKDLFTLLPADSFEWKMLLSKSDTFQLEEMLVNHINGSSTLPKDNEQSLRSYLKNRLEFEREMEKQTGIL